MYGYKSVFLYPFMFLGFSLKFTQALTPDLIRAMHIAFQNLPQNLLVCLKPVEASKCFL